MVMIQRIHVTSVDHEQKFWTFNQNYLRDSPTDAYTLNLRTSSDLLDESHSTRFPVRAKNENVVGGDFHVIKGKYSESSTLGYEPRHFSTYPAEPLRPGEGNYNSTDGYHFYGNLLIDERPHETLIPTAEYSDKPTLAALGTSAIARCLPTNPVANLSGTLAEAASEGMLSPLQLDSMRGKVSSARNAGAGYLNYSFGWAPVVRDVEKLLKSVVNFDKIGREFAEKSGRPLKGSYHYESEISRSEASTSGVYLYPARLPFLSNHTGELTSFTEKRKRQWFEGVFTYFVPSSVMDPVGRFTSMANHALGTRLTPETVWNLAPWSWALDWFANTGDVIHNVVAFQNDGLVMKRGYMMETCTVKIEDTLRGIVTLNYGPVTFHRTRESVSKRRVVVNPYTWASSFDGLDGRQKAILVALGLARTAGHP